VTDDLHSFISDILHGRNLVDRDEFALRLSHRINDIERWDREHIATEIRNLQTSLFRRYREWSRSQLTDLITQAILRRWPADPRSNSSNDQSMIKILFISANPVEVVDYHPVTGLPLVTKPLRLDQEFRAVHRKIRLSDHNKRLELISWPAAKPSDLVQAFNEVRPKIVHFSGHGDTNELVLIDSNGEAQSVPKHALEMLFKTMRDDIKVVVLNACYSAAQAEAIAKHIDCTVGMKQPISDDAAITFASAFYGAIGFGRSVKEAFDQGIVELMLGNSDESLIPKLHSRKGIDPSKVNLI
jgi:hypothetical protein